MSMVVLEKDGFLTNTEIYRIEKAIMRVNYGLVVPFAQTGELIISYRLRNEVDFHTAYHATLHDGPGGSCADRKIRTLITHTGTLATGQIPASALAEGEVNHYGSNRLFVDILLDSYHPVSDEDTPTPEDSSAIEGVEMLIAFSDRKDWQDELYVAAAKEALGTWGTRFFSFIGDSLDKDPVIGTARRIIRATTRSA